MEISDILKEIDKIGIQRYKYDVVREKAIEAFINIAKKLAEKDGKVYDIEPVMATIEFIIDWTYLLKDNIDGKKGFIIKGATGRGKTFMFKVWNYFLQIDDVKYSHNGKIIRLQPILVTAKRIAGEYSLLGYEAIDRYSKINNLVIDDVGSEPAVNNNYGNQVNVIAEIIANREEAKLLTFATTNIAKLSDIYDDRTISRLYNLFSVLLINHDKDYRKNQKL